MRHYREEKGLTIIETVVSIAIAAVVMGGILTMLDRIVHFRGTANTMGQIKKIEIALDTTYRENISYIENTCYGWTDAACNALTLVPAVNGTDATKVLIKTFSANATGAWRNAGCTLTGTSPSYTAQCPDGYNANYTFVATNTHTANSNYLNGYNRTPFALAITSGGNAAITDTWSSGYLDGEYSAYSQKKLLTLTNALKSYHISRLTNEAVVGTCKAGSGGLESYDDVIVPWYFQVTGTVSIQSCAGVESGNCGCSGFAATVWPASGSGWNQINSTTKFARVLGNIGLNSLYRVDGFGNPLQIWLTVNSGGTLQGEPPRPQPGYSGVWSVRPPYYGVVGVYTGATWAYSQNVVYAQ